MYRADKLTNIRRRRVGLISLAALLAGTVLAVQPEIAAAAQPGRDGPRAAVLVPRIVSSVGPLGAVRNYVPGQHATPSANGPLAYHGGPVQHGTTVYAIFWQPPCVPGQCPSQTAYYYLPPSYRNLVAQYFADLSTDSYRTANVFSVDTQYYDLSGPSNSKRFVSYDVHFGGIVIDHDVLPTSGCALYAFGGSSTINSTECLTDAQIQAEVNKVVATLKLPRGLGSQYFLYTPYSIASCFHATEAAGTCYDPSSASGYCAYHSAFTPSQLPITLYANMPYNDVQGCQPVDQFTSTPAQYPNTSPADPVISTTSHELSETMTDPTQLGWWNPSTHEEDGDHCAYNMGAMLGTDAYVNGGFNQVIAGDFYWTQQEWSNRSNSCAQRNNFPQPTASFKVSASPRHGKPVTFTSTVKDGDGDKTFTYAWSFGDGASSSLASPSHTYATAGTKTVTLVVTDPIGDAVRVVNTVKVA